MVNDDLRVSAAIRTLHVGPSGSQVTGAAMRTDVSDHATVRDSTVADNGGWRHVTNRRLPCRIPCW
jgi:hypothetical protein